MAEFEVGRDFGDEAGVWLSRPRTFTAPHGLKARKVLNPGDELVICAAIQMPDGYVVMGHRHDAAILYASRIERYRASNWSECEQGFVTSADRFVGRKEAHMIHAGTPGMLFSEDIY